MTVARDCCVAARDFVEQYYQARFSTYCAALRIIAPIEQAEISERIRKHLGISDLPRNFTPSASPDPPLPEDETLPQIHRQPPQLARPPGIRANAAPMCAENDSICASSKQPAVRYQ
jgi:hypothetical protein